MTGSWDAIGIGVDLSTEDGKVGVVSIDGTLPVPDRVDLEVWSPRSRSGQDDESLVDAILGRARSRSRAVVAIDAPFGWPLAWSAAVAEHRPGAELIPPAGAVKGFYAAECVKDLTWRETDKHVSELRLRPASGERAVTPQRVAASWLGATATRCARLLARLRHEHDVKIDVGIDGPSSGGIRIIETYPAAARCRLAEHERSLIEHDSDHVMDALIAAVVAVRHLMDSTDAPDAEATDAETLAREGWIWLPTSEV